MQVQHLMAAIVIFWDQSHEDGIRLWMQIREDDGRFQGMWEFPGGGIEKGESPEQAMVREVEEEVGINLDSSDQRKMFDVYNAEFEDKVIHLHTFLGKTSKLTENMGKWFVFKDNEDIKQLVGKTPDANPKIIEDVMKYINGLRENKVEHLIWN